MISWFRKDMSWKEINEEFTRWTLETPIGNILVHRMYAPIEHQYYHDHPWNFLAIVLRGGYWETLPSGRFWRKPGSILWRPAMTKHKTTTKVGQISWSICFTGPKYREWNGDLI